MGAYPVNGGCGSGMGAKRRDSLALMPLIPLVTNKQRHLDFSNCPAVTAVDFY